jgi:hypothetical protein
LIQSGIGSVRAAILAGVISRSNHHLVVQFFRSVRVPQAFCLAPQRERGDARRRKSRGLRQVADSNAPI